MKKCNVCHGKYITNKNYCNNCSVYICDNCLHNWFLEKDICPICRKKDDIIYIKKDIENECCFKKQIYPENYDNTIEETKYCSCDYIKLIWFGIKREDTTNNPYLIYLIELVILIILWIIGYILILTIIFINDTNNIHDNFIKANTSFIFHLICPGTGLLFVMVMTIICKCCNCTCNLLCLK